MDRLDLALDDLIKAKPRRLKKQGAGKKENGKKVAAKSAGGAGKKMSGSRNSGGKLIQPTGASHVLVKPAGGAGGPHRQQGRQHRAAGGRGGDSILSRVGPARVPVSGTPVTFENLNFDIMKDDVAELCGTIGEVKSVQMIYDRSGRSTGSATATFARRSDAISAVKKFNGLTLDGTEMSVSLSGPNDNSRSSGSPARQRSGSADGKASMFGTAIGRDTGPTFKVNLGGKSGRGFGNRDKSGRGRGGKGRGGRAPASAASLDDELDGYFASR